MAIDHNLEFLKMGKVSRLHLCQHFISNAAHLIFRLKIQARNINQASN